MSKKNKFTFVLDIGTRSIIGVLLEKIKQGIKLQDIVVHEQTSRAMLDGQIHNIPEVSDLVRKVKEKLEQNTGKKMKKVAVAAAGRSLITINTTVFHDYHSKESINKDDVLKLELKGAQKAQSILIGQHKKKDINNYYCVGYSVTRYFLDDSEIGSLIEQKGRKIGLEMVVAFLPKIVVESLHTVLKENKLEMASITLEPIAAINAILPPSMHKLNLALVDVGAGTSDIAISSNGSIIAYGMVPVAGDEITEAICEKYLLDFNEGEKLKRKLNDQENDLEFTDILGFEHCLKASEIVGNISDHIKELAQKIGKEIIKLNTKSPQAVILIGGGSLTPLLSQHLAEYLGLTNQRVAVQKASSIKEITDLAQDYQGPEIITPLGIGLTALKDVNLGFIPVQVNGHDLNLLNLGNYTVLDALLAAGLDSNKLYGRPGLALAIEVNNKLCTFPGTLGERAVIKVNGAKGSLDTLINSRDKIEFIPAKDGQRGKGFIKDLVPSKKFIEVNKQLKELPLEITIDGKSIPQDTELKDGDKIFIREITQLGEVLDYWKVSDQVEFMNLTLNINGQSRSLTLSNLEIRRDGSILDFYEQIKPGDKLEIIEKDLKALTAKELIKKHGIIPSKEEYFEVIVNEQSIKIPTTNLEIKINGQQENVDYSLTDGDVIEVNYCHNKNPILVDIFTKINFSLTPPAGKTRLEILINGKDAEYTASLKHGDKIDLLWI